MNADEAFEAIGTAYLVLGVLVGLRMLEAAACGAACVIIDRWHARRARRRRREA